MGCGASTNDPNAVSAFQVESPTSPNGGPGANRMGVPHDEPPEIPENIVLVSATRPDWKTTDHLVFETKLDEDCDEEIRCVRGHAMTTVSPEFVTKLPNDICSKCATSVTADDTIGVCWECASTMCAKCFQAAAEDKFPKGGHFYSQLQSSVGTWRILGNVLTLIWPLSLKQDTVMAVHSPKVWVNYKTHLKLNVLEPRGRQPRWFSPDIIAEKFQADSAATLQFECPVCYFELHMFPSPVIRSHSRRSCSHYFHKECAHFLLQAAKGSGRACTCPLCGAEFAEAKPMPDLSTEPREWFACVDSDFGGELDIGEVIEALGTVMPLNRHKLEKNVKAHWHEWDPDGDGSITLNEFIYPGRGLRDWILSNISLIRAEKSPDLLVPSLDKDPRQWFRYWDRNGNGTLEKDEVIRAFVRSFCRDENGNPSLRNALDMREVTLSLWTTMNYGPFHPLTFEEFVKPYGLMDNFMHNNMHCLYFGLDAELIA